VNQDDLILISVDDHIAEPADMFRAHVPERYRDRAPRPRFRGTRPGRGQAGL
jgi:hypothetical protein